MTQFVIPNADPIATLTFDKVVTIDISSFINEGDYISISLPEFPRTKIDITQSYVDFTSNEQGDFGTGATDSIKFSEASPALPATAGDTEMRIPISLFKTLDKSRVTGVRFRIFATEECTFRCLSIRACDVDWKFAPIDLDTLWNRVHRPPAPSGSTGTRTNFFTNPTGELAKKILTDGTGWTGTRQVESLEIPAYAGEYRDKYEMSSAGARLAASSFTFPAAGTYVMSMYVWLNSEWNGGKLKIAFGSDFTKETETILEEADATKKGQWQRVSTKVKVGSADLIGTYELAYVSAPSTGAKSVVYTDALMVEAASVPGTYFDGSYPGAKWTGSANSSTSTIISSSFPIISDFEGGWPRVFRSTQTFGITDPMPVNLEVAAHFTAGTFTQAKSGGFNEIGLIFRDVPVDDQTQVEVNSFTQSQLDGLGKQPDFGKALYDSRDQTDLEIETQGEIDTTTQFALERKRDESEHSWIEVRLKWNETTGSNKLTIYNADEIGYSFTGMTIEKSSATELEKGNYALIVALVNSTCRVRIYKVDQVGNIGAKVYDTGTLRDETLFKRRKGRFGWYASLLDGDAYIHSVKSRGVNYGEVISKEFQSITPVKGVTLFSGSTLDKQLVERFEPASPYTTISVDPSATSSGKAIKVTTTPGQSLQGVATNIFKIDDPDNLAISFDIKFPSSQIPGGGLSAFLIGAYEQVVPLTLTGFTRDTWSHVKVSIPVEETLSTGSYQFVLMQTLPVTQADWWIENLSITTSSVKWSARSYASEPWADPEERWQPAGFTLNSEQGGIVFSEPGNGLQIRGQTFRQNAEIHDYKALPQYATLGRVRFEKQAVAQQSSVINVEHAGSEALSTIGGIHELGWSNPTFALVSDTNYASGSPGPYITTTLIVTGFNFSVPSTATIKGIKASILRKGTTEDIVDTSVLLVKGGVTTGTNMKAVGISWPLVAATQNYGGEGVFWGTTTSPEEVNNSNFGVGLRIVGGEEFGTGMVNYVTMTIYYTVPL